MFQCFFKHALLIHSPFPLTLSLSVSVRRKTWCVCRALPPASECAWRPRASETDIATWKRSQIRQVLIRLSLSACYDPQSTGFPLHVDTKGCF